VHVPSLDDTVGWLDSEPPDPSPSDVTDLRRQICRLRMLFCGFVASEGAEPPPGQAEHVGRYRFQARSVADARAEYDDCRFCGRGPRRPWRDIGRRGTVTLLSGRLIVRRERAAALGPECGAVEIDPTSPVRRARRNGRKRKKPPASGTEVARLPDVCEQ
jgi:hypothetical protein